MQTYAQLPLINTRLLLMFFALKTPNDSKKWFMHLATLRWHQDGPRLRPMLTRFDVWIVSREKGKDLYTLAQSLTGGFTARECNKTCTRMYANFRLTLGRIYMYIWWWMKTTVYDQMKLETPPSIFGWETKPEVPFANICIYTYVYSTSCVVGYANNTVL